MQANLIAAVAVLSLMLLSLPAPAADSEYTSDMGTASAEKVSQAFPARPYSPYAGRGYPVRPLFGDTHLHTGASFDAGAFGARLTPRDAYRFARGEEVRASSG